MEIYKFPLFAPIPEDPGSAVLARKKVSTSYAFPMIAALVFLPGHSEFCVSWKHRILTKIIGYLMKLCQIGLQDWILMILRGPWPARAGNLNIPMGILRFLSLPGLHGLLQNSKKLKFPPKSHFSTPKLVFPLPELKNAPERYVYVGFRAGAANVDF